MTRRPALATRLLVAGLSASATIVLVDRIAAADDAPVPPPAPQVVQVVVTVTRSAPTGAAGGGERTGAGRARQGAKKATTGKTAVNSTDRQAPARRATPVSPKKRAPAPMTRSNAS